MFLGELWEKVNGLLNRSDIPNVYLQYDTKCSLGDVNVSVLVILFQEMESAPVIPLMVILHETKNIAIPFFLVRREAFPLTRNCKKRLCCHGLLHGLIHAFRMWHCHIFQNEIHFNY